MSTCIDIEVDIYNAIIDHVWNNIPWSCKLHESYQWNIGESSLYMMESHGQDDDWFVTFSCSSCISGAMIP